MSLKTSITRKEHFNAAHRLHNENWSDEINKSTFGHCNNEYFHGHNYDLEVKVSGFCDPQTGYVIDAKKLKNVIKTKVIDEFDHKNLNIQVKEFFETIPTVENIARVIYDRLRNEIDEKLDIKIKLYETPRIFAEYPG
ncbi:MAG: 6-pyruvoyl tetrahydrobiopterin synthase [Flavobacteriales bacterium]|nr:6-pyruvoyl tetrahydrobiopterin synthase [Flavobacteriales bacterium]|tara:strand:- start:28997 stop:29410 length:414 start_codon:yes stop_codon:yes gene_type:complete